MLPLGKKSQRYRKQTISIGFGYKELRELYRTPLQNDAHCCELVPHFLFPCGRIVRRAELHTAAR